MKHKNAAFIILRIFLLLGMILPAFGPSAPVVLADDADVGRSDAPKVSDDPQINQQLIQLNVIAARTEPDNPGGPVTIGDPITQYRYLINVDNTGDPTQPRNSGCNATDPGYPDSCDWPSIRAVPGSAPIYTQGNQDDFVNGGLNLPDGKYLITVMADNYKLGGQHFTVPHDTGTVTVALQPHPLPPATLRIKVFEDVSPTNGQFDAPAESGLEGFMAVVNDTLGQVSTDVYGNPLCTEYDAAMNPIGVTNCLLSDVNGEITIPNLGPLRYDVLVNAPNGEFWLETTTLEGSWSWDTWLQEGGTGLDNEFVVAGEPFPWTMFGFVQPCQLGDTTDRCPANDTMGGATGGVSGTIIEASVYLPQQGALPYFGDIWTGFNGTKVTGPITDGWIAISDLQQGDTAIYVGPANPDGTFSITGLPDGDYLFTWWDYRLHHILDWIQVAVSNGEVYDIGTPMLTGWFTKVEGYVFIDSNMNGVKDPGEPGKSDYLVVLRDRDNSEIDRMSISAVTDMNGYYVFEKAYPMSSWMVLEAYNDRYFTTGITYQVDNQLDPTTVLGNGVDVGFLPILGQPARLDWGILPYSFRTNGGIVGSVFYDTTRNELNPAYQAVEPWAAGIPNLTMNLYAPVPCGTTGAPCDGSYIYELAPDGSYAKGPLLNATTTEIWEQPTGCTARDANGVALPWGVPNQEVLPTDGMGGQDTTKRCLEAPLMGTQIQSGFATLDGNWGFGGIWHYDDNGNVITDTQTGEPIEFPMGAGNYLVEVQTGNDALGRPLYQVVREEDINVFGGDLYAPDVPPPACAGPLHTVDVAGVGVDGYPALDLGNGIIVPASTPVYNPSFAETYPNGIYEGQQKPLCNTKLVNLANGKSVAPLFTYFTEVPIPGKWKGYIIDDLTVSTDYKSLNFGEKGGMPNAPIGIYDFNMRLVTTIRSDPNGVFEVLLPSTYTTNCPSPSGVCAAMYYMLGNDPGQPNALNVNYNPQYRTIGATFEIYPGLIIPSDLAPTQIVPGVLAGGSQWGTPPQCTINDPLNPSTPELFAVSQPYFDTQPGADGSFTIRGQGFGTTPGTVTLGGIVLSTTGWSDTQIDVSISAATETGAHQLGIQTADGKVLVNGLTFHVLGEGSQLTFPQAVVLDDFNRADGPLGPNWSAAGQNFRISGNNVRVSGNGSPWWDSTQYSADQEAFFTFTQVGLRGIEQGLLLKLNGNPGTGALIEVAYNNMNSRVLVRTKTAGQGFNLAVTQARFDGVTFAAGDQIGARTFSNGLVEVYKNGVLIGSVDISATPNPWPQANIQGGGFIGVRFVGITTTYDARFDDFGGGTITLDGGYSPAVYEVGPGKPYSTIQSAIDAAATTGSEALVVVYPDTPVQWNPIGAYFENLIMYSPVKLQGIGPGGVYANGTPVLGSVIDGRGVAGDTAYAEAWRIFVEGLAWDGNQAIYEGPVVYILAEDGEFQPTFNAAVDGFTITGGDQQGFPANLQPVDPFTRGFAAVQGGGVFANAYARYLQITNNILSSNGGAYAGAIRIGTPHLPDVLNDNQNDFITIMHNRVIANGGTNLAGGIGLFSGSEGYEVAYNDICGNFSAEYGGGISHYGLSPNSKIHHNRVFFNRSYDEGGGIIIAGELTADPGILTPGAGAVDIYNNLIQNNLGNDDGGGLRFLMAGNFSYNVFNNIIVNNVSTHEGAGISINDAPDVRVFNNTIMKNITTATAMTSNGTPAPAGLSTSLNSALLQQQLIDTGSPFAAWEFSNPVMFNNIFWDNRAGTFTGATIAGIGLPDDPNPIFNWDIGLQNQDFGFLLQPTYSLLQSTYGAIVDGTNIVGVDPLVIETYDTTVSVAPWRGNPRFVDIIMVTALADPNVLGDYHLLIGSPAIDTGTNAGAPSTDIDDQARPSGPLADMGGDEYY